MKKKYVEPDLFCSFPSMGYWAIDGRPVSPREALNGLNPRATYERSEVANNLHRHVGQLIEC